MIDTKELRRLAQAALIAPGSLSPEWMDRLGQFQEAADPSAISELLDRLEAAEKKRDDLLACLGEWLDKTEWVQQGVTEGMISAKYLGLHRADVMASLLGEAEKERDVLRAKIEQMERQEPVGEIQRANSTGNYINAVVWVPMAVGSKLYALPGAQPAPSVPTALLVAAANLVAQMEIVRRVGFVDTPNDQDSCAAFCVAEGTWLELMSCVEALTAALAAPEAKP